MISEIIPKGFLDSEFYFNFSRSSGPGGQNVNKVNTRVELRFNIDGSKLLSKEQKLVLHKKFVNKINSSGELIMVSQSERSQLANKESVIEKFYREINIALKPQRIRKKTIPSIQSIERRLKDKRENSEKKFRRNIF